MIRVLNIHYNSANTHWSPNVTVAEKKNISEEIAVQFEMGHYYHKNHTEVILGFVRNLMGLNSISDNVSFAVARITTLGLVASRNGSDLMLYKFNTLPKLASSDVNLLSHQAIGLI